jgi:hypothetical protein
MRETFEVGLKRRHKAGELSGDIPRPSMTRQRHHPWPAAISGCLELLAELGRILNAWDTEFTRAAEEVQVRRIERN